MSLDEMKKRVRQHIDLTWNRGRLALAEQMHSPEAPDGHIADFAELLHAVAALDGVERIRYTTSHPLEFSDAIITYRKNKRPFHPSPTALDRS